MPTTLQEIQTFLDEEELKYRVHESRNFLRLCFKSDKYTDTDGDYQMDIVVALEEDGEFIKVVVPRAYKFDQNLSSFHKLALFQTLLHISFQTKMVQFEYDVDDGEISAIIEFPIEDSSLSKKQLLRCINGLAILLEKHHEVITDAINHGITPEGREQERKAFEEFQRQRREERRQHLSED